MANFNAADIGCGCDMTVEAKIAGNGSKSDNNIWANTDHSLSVFQDGNKADISNWLDSNAKTGNNDLKGNTDFSGVDPSIFTGNAGQGTAVKNSANENIFSQDGSLNLPWGNMNFTFDLSHMW